MKWTSLLAKAWERAITLLGWLWDVTVWFFYWSSRFSRFLTVKGPELCLTMLLNWELSLEQRENGCCGLVSDFLTETRAGFITAVPSCQSTLTTSRSLKRKTSLWWAACFCTLLTSVTSKRRLQHTSRRWGTDSTCRQHTGAGRGSRRGHWGSPPPSGCTTPPSGTIPPTLPRQITSPPPLLAIDFPVGAVTEKASVIRVNQRAD